MKQCPTCKTTYTDESLSFCLADGASLISLSNREEETKVISGERNPLRINVAPETSPVFTPPATKPDQPVRRGVSPLIVGVLAALLLLVILGFAGFAAYTFLKPDNNKIISASPTPTSADKDLKEKIANLEKQIQDQKNQAKPTPERTVSLPDEAKNTARVNSPGDGFLALRSEPDTEIGERIAKIPHGASVKVESCLAYTTIGKRRGRWCWVEYNGEMGWVFDAWLNY